MENNNVFEFKRPDGNPQTVLERIVTQEQYKEAENEYRRNYATAIAIDIFGNILQHMNLAGVNNVKELHDAKDALLVVESIKSLILKGQEIHHPLQDLAQEVIGMSEVEMSDETTPTTLPE